MSDLDGSLRAHFRDLAGRAPHDPDLATTIHRRARRRAAVTIALTASSVVTVVAVVLVVGAAVLGAGRTDEVAGPPPTPTRPSRRALRWTPGRCRAGR